MRLAGRMLRAGKFWAIEVPLLSVVTQGRTRKDSYEMIADAIESLVNKPDFQVLVYPSGQDTFEIGSNDPASLIALLLRQQRTLEGLTLADVARRIGARSLNTYARYEQGVSMPSMLQLTRLLSALSPGRDLVLSLSDEAG